jgi:hypothetical protein
LEEVNYSFVVIDTPQDDIEDFALTIIHHKRKYTSDKEPSKEDLSGSQALNAKPRCIYELRANHSTKV